MRFEKYPSYVPKGVTARKIAAQKRKQQKERESMPLLADWVSSHQKDPVEIVKRNQENTVCYFQFLRNKQAESWRLGRNFIFALPPFVRWWIVSQWNESPIPKQSGYFLDFLRRKFGF